MVTSSTKICNMALSHIGQSIRIKDLTEQSPAAAECNLWYDHNREMTLRAHDWNFARRRVALVDHADVISTSDGDPWAGTWGYRYVYPSDSLVIRKIQNPNAPPDDATPFDVETSIDGSHKTILCNLDDAVAVYTSDQEDTNTFTPLFISALSHLIAHNIAMPLTGKRNIKLDEFKLYVGVLSQAGADDANERMDRPPRDADWIRARSNENLGTSGAWRALPDANN